MTIDEIFAKFFDSKKDKYTILYLRKHGVDSGINNFELPSKYPSKEYLYKECIEKDKKWQDIVKPIPKDAIL